MADIGSGAAVTVVLAHDGLVEGVRLSTAQQSMSRRAGSTVIEISGSQAVYVSKPEAVAALTKRSLNQ